MRYLFLLYSFLVQIYTKIVVGLPLEDAVNTQENVYTHITDRPNEIVTNFIKEDIKEKEETDLTQNLSSYKVTEDTISDQTIKQTKLGYDVGDKDVNVYNPLTLKIFDNAFNKTKHNMTPKYVFKTSHSEDSYEKSNNSLIKPHEEVDSMYQNSTKKTMNTSIAIKTIKQEYNDTSEDDTNTHRRIPDLWKIIQDINEEFARVSKSSEDEGEQLTIDTESNKEDDAILQKGNDAFVRAQAGQDKDIESKEEMATNLDFDLKLASEDSSYSASSSGDSKSIELSLTQAANRIIEEENTQNAFSEKYNQKVIKDNDFREEDIQKSAEGYYFSAKDVQKSLIQKDLTEEYITKSFKQSDFNEGNIQKSLKQNFSEEYNEVNDTPSFEVTTKGSGVFTRREGGKYYAIVEAPEYAEYIEHIAKRNNRNEYGGDYENIWEKA